MTSVTKVFPRIASRDTWSFAKEIKGSSYLVVLNVTTRQRTNQISINTRRHTPNFCAMSVVMLHLHYSFWMNTKPINILPRCTHFCCVFLLRFVHLPMIPCVCWSFCDSLVLPVRLIGRCRAVFNNIFVCLENILEMTLQNYEFNNQNKGWVKKNKLSICLYKLTTI